MFIYYLFICSFVCLFMYDAFIAVRSYLRSLPSPKPTPTSGRAGREEQEKDSATDSIPTGSLKRSCCRCKYPRFNGQIWGTLSCCSSRWGWRICWSSTLWTRRLRYEGKGEAGDGAGRLGLGYGRAGVKLGDIVVPLRSLGVENLLEFHFTDPPPQVEGERGGGAG